MIAPGKPEKLRLGKVINNTLSFIGRNLIFSLGVGALFFVLPTMLVGLAGFWYWSRLPFSAYGGHWSIEAFMLACRQLAIASSFVGCAVFSSAAIDDIKGRPSIGNCIQAARRHALPIMGVGFAVYLTFFSAGYAMLRAGLLTRSEVLAVFFVLIAPFVPWGLEISVAVPVAIQEGLGVGASISRSRLLTRGYRWPIFGLSLIVIALFLVKQVGAAMAYVFIWAVLAPISALIVMMLLGALASAMIWTVTSITIAAVYIELRWIKEGASVDELAEIFS